MNDVDEGLRKLVERGFRFHHLDNGEEGISVVIGWFGWPEFDDRIQINGENDAIAARAPTQATAETHDVVWSYHGDTLAAINALLELPRPDEPGAPRLTRSAPSGLWIPGAGIKKPR
jgi:hypothetical protein